MMKKLCVVILRLQHVKKHEPLNKGIKFSIYIKSTTDMTQFFGVIYILCAFVF